MLQKLFWNNTECQHSTFVAFMMELSSKPRVKTLKRLSDTRWACRSDAVQAVYEKFEAIVKSLERTVELVQKHVGSNFLF